MKFQKVTFELEIEKIMQSMCEARARLVVRFHEGEDSVRSEVVSIDTESGVLGISSFANKSGETVMPPKEKITVATVVGGMECLFETTIAYKSTTHGAHELNFPKVLQYLQKRSAYRVDTREVNMVIECSLEGKNYQGKVIDISATGARFIPDDKAWYEAATEGQQIPKCDLSLPNLGSVSFSAAVRFKGQAGRGESLIGIEINEMSNHDQVKLERFIRLRDLELRRKASDL